MMSDVVSPGLTVERLAAGGGGYVQKECCGGVVVDSGRIRSREKRDALGSVVGA
jgi:hypothetical protein